MAVARRGTAYCARFTAGVVADAASTANPRVAGDQGRHGDRGDTLTVAVAVERAPARPRKGHGHESDGIERSGYTRITFSVQTVEVRGGERVGEVGKEQFVRITVRELVALAGCPSRKSG